MIRMTVAKAPDTFAAAWLGLRCGAVCADGGGGGLEESPDVLVGSLLAAGGGDVSTSDTSDERPAKPLLFVFLVLVFPLDHECLSLNKSDTSLGFTAFTFPRR
jgi:hypothetical protein